jgi:hypothetical protein
MQPAEHKARFSSFVKKLQEAVQMIVPTNLERYQKAAVLALNWINDTMNVKAIRDEFLELLRRVVIRNLILFALHLKTNVIS